MAARSSPPALAVRLLSASLAPSDRDEVLGDLLQTFFDRLDAGYRMNRTWFWLQTLLFAGARLRSPHATPPSFPRSSLMDRSIARAKEAFRHLQHDWRYALGVVVILGAGLGPAAAMMSVVETVLLRPLDYAEPDRLAMVRIDLDQLRGHPGLSPAEAIDLRESGLLAAVETQSRLADVSMQMGDRLVPLTHISMTTGTLAMLGVNPILGRVLREEDMPPPPPPPAPGAPPRTGPPPPPPPQSALLDYDAWQRLFGGAPDTLGRKLQIDGRTTEIVGILPRGFRIATGRTVPQRIDLYTPLGLTEFRNAWQFPTIARLQPGRTFEDTQEGLDRLAADLKREFPAFYPGALRFTVTPVLDDMTKATRPALNAALGAVLLLLVIAAVNAAALVVARLRAREQDFALRQALGASRGALAAQVLAESAWLAGAATLVGAASAAGTMAIIRRVVPRTVPRWDHLEVGWTLLLYAGAFAFAALLMIGLALIWKVSRTQVVGVLRAASTQGGRAEGTLSRLVLAGAQMALAVMLAFGAVQLGRSARNLGQVDLGFDPDVLTMRVAYDFRRFNSNELRADLYHRIRDRVAQVPGVSDVGISTHVPLSGATMMDGYEADLSKEPSFAQAANYQAVTAGYFETMRIPIRQGRDFTDAEVATRQPVVVVDDTLIQTVFPGESDVIGRTLRLGWGLQNARIVGVVGHARSIEIGRAVRPQVYSTVGNLFQIRNGALVVVRAEGDPMALRGAIENAILEIGPGRAVTQVAMLSDNVDAAMSALRAVTGLVLLLAMTAAALSAAGLYIVVAYLVHERRRSAAIRTALGATQGQVVWAHLRVGGVVMAIALTLGTVGAIASANGVTELLYGVSARDPLSLVLAVVVAMAVSSIAMYVPARRAASGNILKILRES